MKKTIIILGLLILLSSLVSATDLRDGSVTMKCKNLLSMNEVVKLGK